MPANKKLNDMPPGRHLHFVGIGGAGMSAIAKIMFKQGYRVSGSDVKESSNTIWLKELGVQVFIGHDASNIRGADIIVVSTAIKASNPEIAAARSTAVPIYKRAEVLGWLMSRAKTSIAFAGTHGKTTTSSMASLLFSKAGLKPTYLVGSELLSTGTNAEKGNGKFSLAEADESDGSILFLDPSILVITNIESDHLEHFGTFEKIVDLFVECVKKLPKDRGVLITQADHWGVKGFLKRLHDENALPAKVVTYGLEQGLDLRPGNVRLHGDGSKFTVFYQDKQLGEVELSVPGLHNVLNALAVIACGFEAGLTFSQLALHLKAFNGTKRRFNLVGEVHDVKIYDDYGHHPTEIAATLAAARAGWPGRRLICIFQPHRFSRTMFLAHEFADCFKDADEVILTDIYAAYEDPLPGVSTDSIVRLMKDRPPVYIPKKEEISKYMAEIVRAGDLVITMGAGDIYIVGKEILNRLKQREEKGWQENVRLEKRTA
jgi:UDP-N-acetylmuramate--alanine ligase